MSSLILIPWHLGDRRDITLHAIEELRRLPRLFCEDPEPCRRALEMDYRIDCRGKQLVRIDCSDERVLAQYLEWFGEGDVGLVASGGVPCFIDPGAWLVAEARRRQHNIVALAGPSALSTVLALSGIDFASGSRSFLFHFFRPDTDSLADLLAKRTDPVVIFLSKVDRARCVDQIKRHRRELSVFLDLAKTGPFPFANTVLTFRVEDWDEATKTIEWDRVSDISLLAR